MHSPDVVIAGAGLVGLACALECERRGLRTVVLERGRAMQQASWAAAGMLAAHDPGNPPALLPLAQHSIALYPAFLEHVAELSGSAVAFETAWTLEQSAGGSDQGLLTDLRSSGFRLIQERSLDPRRLAAAVLAAVQASNITLMEASAVRSITTTVSGVLVHAEREVFACNNFVDCTGAWSTADVTPAKGQMLRVHAPGLLHAPAYGNLVVRTHDIYLVPRLDGSIVIGATVEDAGFDTTVHEGAVTTLMQRAAALVPGIADAPRIESWAGLRPDTQDHLPLLGSIGAHRFIAAGHFRNGILLAPGTAQAIAQLVTEEQPDVDLTAFAPQRFAI